VSPSLMKEWRKGRTIWDPSNIPSQHIYIHAKS
jgi:hypothetical protein